MRNSEVKTNLPEALGTEAELDEALTLPSRHLVEFIKTLSGPLLVLGAGGKMGPTLAVMARRAAEEARQAIDVVAVSRFSDSNARDWLEKRGVKTVSCDMIEENSLRRLPDAGNIIYLVGMKFGTAKDPALTWAMNTIVPARVMERYGGARIVALSTGNVYPLTEVSRGGALETNPLTPLGEYANAAVGRERVFEFYSRRDGTRVTLLRLFYAVELRYGVLFDIAQKIQTGIPILAANGYFNCIWQGDANDMVIRALKTASSPPTVWNLCRPEVFNVRDIATRLGELLGKPAVFNGEETTTALLGNAEKFCAELGQPPTPMDAMLRWTARWVKRGGRSLGRPTHFEVRDGNY